MDYTIEKIYKIVGRFDYVATLTLKKNSEAFKKYGDTLTVQFMYDQFEREKLDKLIEQDESSTNGKVKAKEIIFQLSDEENKQLQKEGINSQDITDIMYFASPKNTFHDKEKRKIQKHIIEFKPLPKGGDYGWIMGFYERLVKENVGLCPQEKNLYLAGRLLFDSENLSENEKSEIYDADEHIKKDIELELLTMKKKIEIIEENESIKLSELQKKKFSTRNNALDTYLKLAGSSLMKLTKENAEQAALMLTKVQRFNERRLNVAGKYPIFIDVDSFLHIYLRHVEEFKVNQHFENKDNFQWDIDDVFSVMQTVIQEIEDDYQKFREAKPNTKYSKYGAQSQYYQGDYYTFHIEPTGRVSTFHKNRKEHEMD